MRKRIALVIFVLIFAFLPNIIPSRLLLTPNMALKMIHKSNESGSAILRRARQPTC